MSNAFAIAAVTATLRSLITRGLPDLPNANITTMPPDKARAAGAADVDQINIFLYQTMPNAAWRNMDLPRQVRPGETAQPPVALNLYYLITAFGKGNEDTLSHQWLGQTVSVLHDHALLGAQEIRDATEHDFPASDLHQQVERLRITPQPLSIDDISKLWTAFQAPYRISAAYEVAVVLIESTRANPSPLPVLQRGAGDRGAIVLASSLPSLTGARPDVQPPNVLPSARLGDALIIEGAGLTGDGVSVRFTRQPPPSAPGTAETIVLTPLPGATAEALRVQLPAAAEAGAIAAWAPGFYTLSLVVALPNLPSWTTNEVPLALAPAITLAPLTAAVGDSVTVTCAPRLRAGQRVSVLFGDAQIAIADAAISIPADATKPATLQFTVPKVSPAAYAVRLRVDGVDSLPILAAGTPPLLQFDPQQRVTVT